MASGFLHSRLYFQSYDSESEFFQSQFPIITITAIITFFGGRSLRFGDFGATKGALLAGSGMFTSPKFSILTVVVGVTRILAALLLHSHLFGHGALTRMW